MVNTEQEQLKTECIYVPDGERLVLACDCRRIEQLEAQLAEVDTVLDGFATPDEGGMDTTVWRATLAMHALDYATTNAAKLFVERDALQRRNDAILTAVKDARDALYVAINRECMGEKFIYDTPYYLDAIRDAGKEAK